MSTSTSTSTAEQSYPGGNTPQLPPGIIFDDHLGWHVHYMVVDLATRAGLRLDSYEQAALDAYRDPRVTDPARLSDAYRVLDRGGIVDRAVAFLNEQVSDPGYSFAFSDGSFGYFVIEGVGR